MVDASAPSPPPVRKVIETCLYVQDLDRSERFYRDVLGLPLVTKQENRHVFLKAGRSMLLLFNPQATAESWGGLPPHRGDGQAHYALEIAPEDYGAWKRHLEARGVKIEHEQGWGKGARSMYFRDPDGHLGELMTAGFWPVDE